MKFFIDILHQFNWCSWDSMEVSVSFNTISFKFDFIRLEIYRENLFVNAWIHLRTLSLKIQHIFGFILLYHYTICFFCFFSNPVAVLGFDSFIAHLNQIEFQMRHFTCDLIKHIFHKVLNVKRSNLFIKRPSGNRYCIEINCKWWKTSEIPSKT